jgi:uncharacterized membrane protein YjgN (DUF898 family)
MNDTKMTQVEFTGKASEYFGIWIVNLLLTILTLGIYSAWAKVRRKKYFYNNTLIDNVGFDYHAKPIAILKGRIIAFIFFVGYAFGGEINVFVPIVFVLLFFLALPWLVVRSSIFNARNTSHRGLRFDFTGKVGEAALVFILLPIVTVLSLYLALPYMSHQKNKFMMSNYRFGLSQFEMKAKVGSFYKVYLIIFIPVIIAVIGIIAAIAIPAYKSYADRAAQHSEIRVPYAVGFVDVGAGNQMILAENSMDQEPYRVERVYSENERLEEPAPEVYQDDEAVVIDNQEKTLEELMAERIKKREEAREKMILDMFKSPSKSLYVLLGVLAYLIFIFAFVAYFKARIGNLVWNNTTLEDLSFKSSLRARDYWWIYLTNIMAIILTFGLATPWAQVRLARYRASKLQLVGDVDFDKFVGERKEAIKATGEEIADFFDADFSFG